MAPEFAKEDYPELNCPDRPIVLIGPRGAGKTSVAPELATLLGCRWLDLDAKIVSLANGENIHDMFAQPDGETRFRQLEHEAIEQALGEYHAKDPATPRIIATGGGIVVREANREAMRARGLVIYLQATVDTLLMRLPTPDRGRPRLKPDVAWDDEIALILEEREPYYLECAHLVVRTDPVRDGHRSYPMPPDVAAKIRQRLDEKGWLPTAGA